MTDWFVSLVALAVVIAIAVVGAGWYIRDKRREKYADYLAEITKAIETAKTCDFPTTIVVAASDYLSFQRIAESSPFTEIKGGTFAGMRIEKSPFVTPGHVLVIRDTREPLKIGGIRVQTDRNVPEGTIIVGTPRWDARGDFVPNSAVKITGVDQDPRNTSSAPVIDDGHALGAICLVDGCDLHGIRSRP